MPETVIVTLLWNGQEADMELPARVPLKGFAEPLKQALCLCFPGFSPGGETAAAEDQGRLSFRGWHPGGLQCF